jgi:predicted DNA-binding protein (UPF0251 family)
MHDRYFNTKEVAVSKTGIIKKVTDLVEYMRFTLDEARGDKDVNQSQVAAMEVSLDKMTTALNSIENGTNLPPVDLPVPVPLPVPQIRSLSDEPEEPDATVIPYEMHLDGSFKSVKSRVVADFAEAYSSRLTFIANGNQSEAARIAGLNAANYKRALRRARESRVT